MSWCGLSSRIWRALRAVTEKKVLVKRANMEALDQVREDLRREPRLIYLFVELTDRCNLACMHCGSRCGPENGNYLDANLLIWTLKTVAEDFPPASVMICLTGGEPMLHPGFYDIAAAIAALRLPWGMTTNGTLIDAAAAAELKRLRMGSITLSLDGVERTHDRFRGVQGNFRRTLEAIGTLQKAGIPVQVTTVVHKKNLSELEQIYDLMLGMGVRSWRVINLEPIGRALERRELMLSGQEFLALLNFIRSKRFDGDAPMEVCFGCSHYLSYPYEREVRDHYFLCASGLSVASILCSGDIYSCLDIERRPELVQGNIARDRFSRVWRERFLPFRTDRSATSEKCRACEERPYCRGDSTHTWDFDNARPRFCIRDIQGGYLDE